MFVYLDNSSTTKPYEQVVEIMTKVLREDFGNPSSLHTLGIDSEKYVKAARKSLAKAMGISSDDFYFTSCGTESDNAAIFGACNGSKYKGKKIITTKVEHPAVLEPIRRLEMAGFEVTYLDVDRKCHLNMEQLKSAISKDTALISVMAINNETGTIMPINEIAETKERFNKEHGCQVIFHTDAVQALGKIPLKMNGVDIASVSGHKIHGPKGIGGLYIKKGLSIPAYMIGGGQEHNMRSGTENTAGIAGFGIAADICAEGFETRTAAMKKAKQRLLTGLKSEMKDIYINSPEDDTASPSVLNVSFIGTRGEVLLHTLEQEGIFVSTGSACSSNKKGQSHVLTAMGLSPKVIEGTIRFSFSEFNTEEEMDYTVEKVKETVNKFRRLGSFR